MVGLPLPAPVLVPDAVGVLVRFQGGQVFYLLTARHDNAYR